MSLKDQVSAIFSHADGVERQRQQAQDRARAEWDEKCLPFIQDFRQAATEMQQLLQERNIALSFLLETDFDSRGMNTAPSATFRFVNNATREDAEYEIAYDLADRLLLEKIGSSSSSIGRLEIDAKKLTKAGAEEVLVVGFKDFMGQ